VARKAGVDRSFLYRHHDLRAQVHVRSAAPAASPASTAASKQSLLADLANLREQNQRLRRQNTDLTARLPEVLGEEAFRSSGIGRTDDTGALRTRVSQLEACSQRPSRLAFWWACVLADCEGTTCRCRKPVPPGWTLRWP
jgi:hypothetical protein